MAEHRARPSGARSKDFALDLSDEFTMVYELWTDKELEWVEVEVNQVELAQFLEAWCEKNGTIFRRARPFLRRRSGRARHEGATNGH